MTKETTRTVLQSMIALASAALGLVAALAGTMRLRKLLSSCWEETRASLQNIYMQFLQQFLL
jgi:hypothetical protein